MQGLILVHTCMCRRISVCRVRHGRREMDVRIRGCTAGIGWFWSRVRFEGLGWGLSYPIGCTINVECIADE